MTSLNQVKSTYSFWGDHPALYGIGTWLTFLGQEKQLRGRVAQTLNLQPGNTVLDVACGTGRNFRFLEQAVGSEGRILGFDYSEQMLRAARKSAEQNRWKNIELFQGDAAQLDIPHHDIDGALSTLGISAVPDFKSAIQRVRDVLKKGGRFAVCDAKAFEGVWRIINPLIKPLYRKTASWEPERDIPGAMQEVFGNVQVEKHLGGAFYIAASVK